MLKTSLCEATILYTNDKITYKSFDLGVNFYRDVKKVRKLEILKSGRAKRDKDGNVISQLYQARLPSGTMARVEPNRRWFGMCYLSHLYFGKIQFISFCLWLILS